ncbi:cation transporter [Zoogloea sp.]|uniref:cation transporter n=1 Tax=Zoogloea sp. TaxID=49181 RepID=UPI00258D0C09|nr:cation transporter [Zoogloea sp.]MDD2669778.1 cation transporter [Zoogloea sp.]
MSESSCSSTGCGCSGGVAAERVSRGEAVAAPGEAHFVSRFRVGDMDCPAEESLVRMALDGQAHGLEFDLLERTVSVWHAVPVEEIESRIARLGMGCERLASGPAEGAPVAKVSDPVAERRALSWLLAINAAMFVIEGLAGWWAESSGLLADGLDMFADAAVYAVALYAVGRGAALQLKAARFAGWLQLLLGLGLFGQVAEHVLHGSTTVALAMMGVSVLALIANVGCMWLIAGHRDGGAHMKASYIFTANDALANLGVIVAGGLVAWLGSPWPDWVVGSIIGAMVLAGAVRILRLR